MPRTLRADHAGAFHHVMARGNRGAEIYLDDIDRRSFLTLLAEVVVRAGWRCHGCCLMSNHFHLLLETPAAMLGEGMRNLNGIYTQRFNRRRRQRGHLFEGRYKSVLVEREAHLLELIRYLALNPVRAGLVKNPQDWQWSHHRAYLGLSAVPDYLTRAWMLSLFAGRPDAAQKAYELFVFDGLETLSDQPQDVLQLWPDIGEEVGNRSLAESIEPTSRPALGELAAGEARERGWMLTAYDRHHYRLREIAEAAGLHEATVSRIIRNLRQI